MADTMPWEDYAKTEDGPWNDFKSADKPTVADPAASVADLEDIKQKAKAVGEDAQSSPILNATPWQAANIPITKALPQGAQNLLREAILPPGLKEAGEMLPGKAGQIVRGATEGGQDVAESFTSPVGILTMAAKAPKAIQGVLGAAFSIMGAQQAGEAGGQLVEAYKKGDWQNVAKLATQVVGGVGQAAIGAHQGMGGVKGTINQIRGIPEGADILPRAKQAAEAVATEKAQSATPPPIPKTAAEAGTLPPVPQTPTPDPAAAPPPSNAPVTPLNTGGTLSDLPADKQAQSDAVQGKMVGQVIQSKAGAPADYFAGEKGSAEAAAKLGAQASAPEHIEALQKASDGAAAEAKAATGMADKLAAMRKKQFFDEALRAAGPKVAAKQTGWTHNPEVQYGGMKAEGLTEEMKSELPKQWEFTDKRKGSPTEGLTVYVPEGSSHAEIMDTIAKKSAADAAAKPPPVPAKPPEPAVKESALDPQHQDMLDLAADEGGHQVEVVSGPIRSDDPFAGAIASIDRKTGKIRVNPQQLSTWLKNNVPPGKEQVAIRSLLSEESIHLATPDNAALDYHNSTTAAERAIAQRVYGGKGGEKLSPTMLGHEMLRMRMQQLARMDVRETLEKSLKERWTVKSLLAASDAIRTIRETIGTKASKEGGAITDRIQDNLEAAISAKGGETPAAKRKPTEERTPEFFLPPIKEPGERASASDLGALPEQKIPPEQALKPETVLWNKPNAWRRVTTELQHKPFSLGKMLTEGSRGSETDPVSATRRLVAMEKGGKVDVVSIYPDAEDGARAVDPAYAGKRARPNVPLKSLLDEGYKPIVSMLRTEAVQNFHRHFDSREQFEQTVGKPGDEQWANVRGYEAQTAATQAPSFGKGTEMSDSEAGALHDHFIEHDTVDKAADAVAASPDVQKIRSGMSKAINQIMASDKTLTREQAAGKAFEQFYEKSKSAEHRGDFIKGALGEFGQESPESSGHVPGETVNDLGATESGQEESSPAAINKHSVKAVTQIAQDEAELMKQNIGDFMALGPTKKNLAASVDAASNAPSQIGHQAGTDVRLASASKPTGRLAQMADWQKGKKEVLRAANVLVESGAIAKGGRFDPVMKGQIPVFREMVESRRQAAEALLKTGDAVERRAAKAWIRQAAEYNAELDYAEKHWNDPELVETARRAKAQGDAIWKRLIADGVDVKYDQNHLPHRYDASIGGDESALFKLVNGSEKIIGRNFRDMKKYDTVYAAFKGGGFIPVTRDIASLTEHMVTQGETLMAKRAWRNALNDVEMPDGSKMRVDTEKGADGRQIAPRGYKLVGVNGEYMAIHEDAAGLIKNLTEDSKYNMAERPWRTRALRAEQMLKHTLLIGDLFHMGRMMAYSLSINGLKGPGFNAALSIMDIPKNRVAEAVSKGWLSQEEADWGSTRIKYGGETITRRELGEKFVRQMGSNVGKIQDALYKDLITKHTAATHPIIKGMKTALDPSFGRYNRFLFDKFTRGLMMEANIMEFERQTKANPHLNPDKIAQDISRDVNVYFGNIGRQGLLTSATDRDTARLLALAPQWLEGLVTKELTAYSRASGASKLLGQRKGVTNLGTTGRGLARGLIFMLGLTQAANLITRKQFTWQNEEKDEKWSAYIGNKEGDGVFLNPWSLFNEITSDAWDYAHARDKTTVGAINQIVGNHESPLARAAIIGVLGAQAGMQKSTTSMGQLKQAGEQLVPAPLSFGALGRAAGHAVAPSLVAPNKPGVALQRGLATFGLKTKIAESPVNRVTDLAQTFAKENGFHTETGWQEQATNEPSYSKLRSALRTGDEKEAQKQFEALRKTRTDQAIFHAMKLSKQRPFTGSKKAEREFINSMDDKTLALYQKALDQKEREYQSFEDFALKQP